MRMDTAAAFHYQTDPSACTSPGDHSAWNDSSKGRELGILAGSKCRHAEFIPGCVREKYKLYDNKICTGDEAAECRFCMQNEWKALAIR